MVRDSLSLIKRKIYMPNIYVITYGWREEGPEEVGDACLRRYRLEVSTDVPGFFPFANIDYTENERPFEVCIYDMEEEDCHSASSYYTFDKLEDAKKYCEYKLLGGPPPECLKIDAVEATLDGRKL